MAEHLRGFTLIEVLVVLVLIGILTTLAVSRVGSDNDHAAREARRFAAVLDVASREAVIEARELALVLEPHRYRFTRLERGAWQADAFDNDRALAPHVLSEGVRMRLQGGQVPERASPLAEETSGDEIRAHVLILSSGEITPFELEIRPSGSDRSSWFVTAELDGHIAYHEGSP